MPRRVLFVSPIERLIYLRTVPLFAHLTADELVAVAGRTREHHFTAGDRLVRRGEAVEEVHTVVEGRVQVSRKGERLRALGSRDSIGLLSLLATRGAPSGQDVEAVASTRGMSLALSSFALFDLFERRFSIYHHVLLALCRMLRGERARRRRELAAAAPRRAPLFGADPDLVDRMLVLGAVLAFARSSAVALSQLASAAELERFDAGDVLWRRGEAATHLVVPLAGSLRCSAGDGARFVVDSGVMCGFIDSMSESARSYSAIAAGPVTALRLDRDVILDALEDHPGAALDCLAALAGDLLAAIGTPPNPPAGRRSRGRSRPGRRRRP